MEVPFNAIFDEQRKEFGFCFTCEDCVHYDDLEEVCIHEFPNQMHRALRYSALPRPRNIVFCKDFDLG